MRQDEGLVLAGAGPIGMAIARRVGAGKTTVIGDKNPANARPIEKTMADAGFRTVPAELDLASRASIRHLLAAAQRPFASTARWSRGYRNKGGNHHEHGKTQRI